MYAVGCVSNNRLCQHLNTFYNVVYHPCNVLKIEFIDKNISKNTSDNIHIQNQIEALKRIENKYESQP